MNKNISLLHVSLKNGKEKLVVGRLVSFHYLSLA